MRHKNSLYILLNPDISILHEIKVSKIYHYQNQWGRIGIGYFSMLHVTRPIKKIQVKKESHLQKLIKKIDTYKLNELLIYLPVKLTKLSVSVNFLIVFIFFLICPSQNACFTLQDTMSFIHEKHSHWQQNKFLSFPNNPLPRAFGGPDIGRKQAKAACLTSGFLMGISPQPDFFVGEIINGGDAGNKSFKLV